MLDSQVAMTRLIHSLFSLIVLFAAAPLIPWQQQVSIDSPRPGDALQGQVNITGTTAVEGFQAYEVAFAYQQDTTNTWFPLAQGKDAISSDTLATWDTTTITDGMYRVRVMVYLSDGRALQTVVSGLRVRNYTPVETATPAPAATAEGQATSPAGDYLPDRSTPTLETSNPLRINDADLGSSLAMGGLVALGLFVLLGIYLALRALFRRL